MLGITKHPQLHPLDFAPIPKWITFQILESLLMKQFWHWGEMCAFDSKLLNFLINL